MKHNQNNLCTDGFEDEYSDEKIEQQMRNYPTISQSNSFLGNTTKKLPYSASMLGPYT